MSNWIRVGKALEIPPGNTKVVQVDKRIIAIFHTDKGWYAVDERCSHRGGPLSEGSFNDSEVQCPWHGAKFNIQTGECLAAPAGTNIGSYRVRIVEDFVELNIEVS